MSALLAGRRTLLIAENTLREAMRQRLFGCLLAIALGFVLGARWLRGFNFGTAELDFVRDCGFGAMTVFGAVLTIAATAQLFLRDLENGTALVLLAKPVARAEFVVGKFIAVAVLAAGFCALLTVVLGATLWVREAELLRLADHGGSRRVPYAGIAAAGFLQWLKLIVLAGFVLLIASYARTHLFTILAGVFILLSGHLQFILTEIHRADPSLAGRAMAVAVGALVPNFQLFSAGSEQLAADGFAAVPLGRIVAYAAGYVVLTGGLAAWSFRQREL